MEFLSKWIDKPYSELKLAVKSPGELVVAEALVVRMLVEKINKGK